MKRDQSSTDSYHSRLVAIKASYKGYGEYFRSEHITRARSQWLIQSVITAGKPQATLHPPHHIYVNINFFVLRSIDLIFIA